AAVVALRVKDMPLSDIATLQISRPIMTYREILFERFRKMGMSRFKDGYREDAMSSLSTIMGYCIIWDWWSPTELTTAFTGGSFQKAVDAAKMSSTYGIRSLAMQGTKGPVLTGSYSGSSSG
ncbi:hypothetical protein HAX54_026470, partial [Datura stramonium]|nr:hypothetical protein [Datura stramonium]